MQPLSREAIQRAEDGQISRDDVEWAATNAPSPRLAIDDIAAMCEVAERAARATLRYQRAGLLGLQPPGPAQVAAVMERRAHYEGRLVQKDHGGFLGIDARSMAMEVVRRVGQDPQGASLALQGLLSDSLTPRLRRAFFEYLT
jgi:hypothetical protein